MDEADLRPISAFVYARGSIAPWLPTIARLSELPDVNRVVVASAGKAASEQLAAYPRTSVVDPGPLSESLQPMAAESSDLLLVVTAPVVVPRQGFETARVIFAAEPRVAAVCFLCNAAGHLSFPEWNQPSPYAVDGFDETSLTRRLRSVDPELLPVPVQAVAGPAVLVTPEVVSVLDGTIAEFDNDPEAAVVEMLLRASRRGLRSVLDPATYVTRPWEDQNWGPSPTDHPLLRGQLHELHPFFPRLLRTQQRSAVSPLSLAWRTARAKVRGLRVLIDASCLGGVENGTQVQTLSLIEALARRDDVSWVGAGLAGPIPRYAERVLSHPDVEVLRTVGLKFDASVPRADIVHRPFQPGPVPWKSWRTSADRTVVTVQDLIAYGNGAYNSPATWMSYRDDIRRGVSRADGVVVISNDVAQDLRMERLPVSPDRLFVVENGTDHLTGLEEESFPTELHARGWAARPFLLVLGANYSHKNRDLAIRAYRELTDKHPNLGLVLAGVTVPDGSSRVQEVVEGHGLGGVITIPDVTSEERNWLLRHAKICLYPTSAEGFGLVPFEAARFGTPTVHARFGPLAEVLPEIPVVAESWEPRAFATACEALLDDPALAQAQVQATLKAASAYTWDMTAERLVSSYRRLLSEPPRSSDAPVPSKEKHV